MPVTTLNVAATDLPQAARAKDWPSSSPAASPVDARLWSLRSLERFPAMFVLDDLPEKWKHFTEINASYVQGSKFTPDEYAKHQTAR